MGGTLSETQSFSDYFRQINASQFEDLLAEYRKLEEWALETFPEVQFRFEFNSNNVAKTLSVKTTILTSNEYNPDDRLLRSFVLEIPEADWYNTTKISNILKTLFPSNVQVISRILNDYYKKSKAIADSK